MSTPFDAIAPRYDALWTNTVKGRGQRSVVWREFDRSFHSGDRVLDVGCGTGEDACYLTSRGVRVWAIDASAEMVRAARARGVNARIMGVEAMNAPSPLFDGAVSNFGVLNCVSDLPGAALNIGRAIRPGGRLIICLMGPFCWTDLWRRRKGRAEWRGMTICYPRVAEVRRVFAPWFRFERRRSLAYGDHQLYVFTRRSGC